VGGEVGAAVDGLEIGEEEHVERPAARATRHGRVGGHVDLVDIGAFLSVEFASGRWSSQRREG